jgi:hypothetical protein
MQDELKNDEQEYETPTEPVEVEDKSKEGEPYKPNKDRAYDAFKERNEKRDSEKISIDKVKELVEENTQAIRAEINAAREAELIESFSTNDEEKAQIKFHLDNTIKRSSNPLEDVKRAKVLANGHKIESVQKEIEAVRNSRFMGSNGSPASYVPDNSDSLVLTDRERDMATRFGLDPATMKPVSK